MTAVGHLLAIESVVNLGPDQTGHAADLVRTSRNGNGSCGTVREVKKLRRAMMEDYKEVNENETTGMGVNRWLIVAVVALLVVAGISIGYGYRQQIMVGHLAAQESTANATISDLQGQLNTLTGKMNDMAAAQQAAAAAAAAKPTSPSTKAAAKRGPAVDKRYKQLQAQLEAQQKQLKDTQDLVAKNRTDLEGNLSSTRDELNGSIAKTHEELVVLQKRGERNYFEFDLSKAKQFQRFGPLTLSLRRTDTKHMNYDLMMVVDDNQLSKKHVNLYEPIWIHTESEGQPVQVVVNKISKNFIHGYISAPKYKPGEIAAASAATITPAAAHPDAAGQTPQVPKPPDQPQQPEQPEL
jgi:ribosomal protein L12E/L44/L45/RPP1/RPP2